MTFSQRDETMIKISTAVFFLFSFVFFWSKIVDIINDDMLTFGLVTFRYPVPSLSHSLFNPIK